MKHSEEALLNIVNDKSADLTLRASAFLLIFEPIDRLSKLESAAKKRNLAQPYLELRATVDQVAEKIAGLWGPKDPFRGALKKRIWTTSKVWLIHGGKQDIWERVGNYLTTSLELSYIEFNDPREKRVDIQGRLKEMVSSSRIAVAIMSAEDYTKDGKVRARQNVIHEIGLAQSCLGVDRVIIMREEGIEDFSNMQGLVYVQFPKQGDLKAALSDLRALLESRLI